MVGRMVGREKVVAGRGKMSSQGREVSIGEVSVWNLSMRKCQSGNCADTDLSVKLHQKKSFKEL